MLYVTRILIKRVQSSKQLNYIQITLN